MQENICKKWDITPEELKEGVNRFVKAGFEKYYGDTNVLLAILELLTSEDIQSREET